MGPRCSCMNKEDGTTFYFNPIQNKEADEKGGRAKASIVKNTSKNEDNQEELSLLSLCQLQGLARGFILRRRYNKHSLKRDLQQEQRKFFEGVRRQYTKDNLKNADEKYHKFDINGWKKFYENGKCQFNYGRIFNTQFLKNDGMYVGQVNLANQKHGQGELLLKDGSKFTGSWVDNQFKGWGRFIDVNGNLNEGKNISQ